MGIFLTTLQCLLVSFDLNERFLLLQFLFFFSFHSSIVVVGDARINTKQTVH